MSDIDLTRVVVLGLLVGVPALGWAFSGAAAEWRKARVAEQAAVLKQSMIERGFTAADILKVLGADATLPSPGGDLAGLMTEHEYPAVDIGRVTARLAAAPDDLRPELHTAVSHMVEADETYTGDDLLAYIDARQGVAVPTRGLQPA